MFTQYVKCASSGGGDIEQSQSQVSVVLSRKTLNDETLKRWTRDTTTNKQTNRKTEDIKRGESEGVLGEQHTTKNLKNSKKVITAADTMMKSPMRKRTRILDSLHFWRPYQSIGSNVSLLSKTEQTVRGIIF